MDASIFVHYIGVVGNKRLSCCCAVIMDEPPAGLNHTLNYTLIRPIFPQNSSVTLKIFTNRGQDLVFKSCYFIISTLTDNNI